VRRLTIWPLPKSSKAGEHHGAWMLPFTITPLPQLINGIDAVLL
jgi:hypothetical protein